MTLDFSKAFPDRAASEPFIQNYLDKLVENWRDGERAFSRTVLLASLLATTFVLLSLNGIGEVSIFGIKVTNFKILELVTPLLISYQIYSAVNILLWIAVIATTYDATFRFLRPEAYEEDFEQQSHPHGSVIMYLVTSRRLKHSAPFVSSLIYYSGIVRMILIIGIPLAFEIFAGYSLIADPPYATGYSLGVVALMGVLTVTTVPLIHQVIKA